MPSLSHHAAPDTDHARAVRRRPRRPRDDWTASVTPRAYRNRGASAAYGDAQTASWCSRSRRRPRPSPTARSGFWKAACEEVWPSTDASSQRLLGAQDRPTCSTSCPRASTRRQSVALEVAHIWQLRRDVRNDAIDDAAFDNWTFIETLSPSKYEVKAASGLPANIKDRHPTMRWRSTTGSRRGIAKHLRHHQPVASTR